MARRRPPQVHGFLVIDKPAGITSQGLVGLVRRRFSERRVGHAGTLDPDATGVMLIGVGSATRLLTFLVGMDKTYIGEIVFGARTSTLDAAGEVVESFDMPAIDLEAVRKVISENLQGEIMQVPPMVSAIRVGGKRLHQLAREGVEVDRDPRPVRVERFDVTNTDDDHTIKFEVDCSSGTYIRSLADDLGRLMGGGAYLKLLRRTRVGPFAIEEAAAVDDALLQHPISALRDMTTASVDSEVASRVLHGSVLERGTGFAGNGPWAVVDQAGELLAVYGPHKNDTVKPLVVVGELKG